MADTGVSPHARRTAKLAWRVPLVGAGLVFVLGVGLSLMNLDIRGDVQTGGLVALAVLAAAGLALSVRARSGSTRTPPDESAAQPSGSPGAGPTASFAGEPLLELTEEPPRPGKRQTSPSKNQEAA